MSEESADNDGPQKPYRAILAEEIQAGLTELRRSALGLWLSAISAGLDLGFSLLLIAVVITLTGGAGPLAQELLMANAYTVGFIFVVLGRSELFTEHTTLAVIPVLNRRTTVRSLMRLWLIVYAGNLIGAALFAALAVQVGPTLGVAELTAFRRLGSSLVEIDATGAFSGAVLAGWLMGLLSWLVTAARDTISQIVIIWLITFSIGIAHLPHCIAGGTEVLAALFAGQSVTVAQALDFQLWVTLGNICGGVVFVAIIKYAHVAASRPNA